MERFKTLSHSLYECKYHIIWCPKYRYRVIFGDIRVFIRDTLKDLCSWKRFEILEGHIGSDHVHIVMEIPPKYSVSEVVGFLKGKSAIKVFERYDKLRKRYWGRHFWSRGYCVSTLGLDVELIRAYVRHQEKKDKQEEQQGRLW